MNPLISHLLIGLATLVLGVCVGYTLSDRKKFNYQLVQNVAVAVISLLAMTALLVGTVEYQKSADCQAQYNARFTKSLAERTEAADQDRMALQKALEAVLDPAGTSATRLTAIQEWKRSVDEANKKRRENPVPLPPECVKDNV